MVAEKQHIVQSGPYKYIRHPSYAGILTMVLGFGFMATNWVSLLAITVGMFLGLLYRMHVEEQALSQLPGYTAYMQQTKRFIPAIY